MAKYKYSTNPYRICIIELHPYGATYPYHIVIDDIKFHDNLQYCDSIFRRCCVFSSSDAEEIAKVLGCFSDEWLPATNFDDAMQHIQDDYESAKGRINADWGVQGDEYYDNF